MKHAAGWIVIAGTLFGHIAFSPVCLTGEEGKVDLIYERLIEGLANRNPAPKFVGEEGPSQKPYFPAPYDWDEQSRVLKYAQKLVDHADGAWPALVDHLDDDKYSVTFKHDMSVSNETVGDICFTIIYDTLREAYLPHIPKGERAFRRLTHPEIIPDNEFSQWCREHCRNSEMLYETQIDICKWALREIDRLDDVSKDEREKSVTEIGKELAKLRKTRKPILAKTIILRESRSPYSQARAEEIRRKIDANRGDVQK